jgi:hypothetical protein
MCAPHELEHSALHAQAQADYRGRLHPMCNECGWRKGGVDSWNGRACKCGFAAPPMRVDAAPP